MRKQLNLIIYSLTGVWSEQTSGGQLAPKLLHAASLLVTLLHPSTLPGLHVSTRADGGRHSDRAVVSRPRDARRYAYFNPTVAFTIPIGGV